MKHIFPTIVSLLLVTAVGPLFAQQSIADSALAPAVSDRTILLTDSDTFPSLSQHRKIIPRQATIRSLLLPGLGQIYNRQYWKLPVIYGGLGAAIVIFNWNQRWYTTYLAGYREAYNAPTVDPLSGTKTAIVDGKIRTMSYLKQATEQFQRQKTLTLICVVVGWALNAVEANVAAHLKTFDVSDDISVRLEPVLLPNSAAGFLPGIRLALTCR